MIDELTISKIKSVAKAVDVIGEFIPLKKKGANYVGNCPFHNEKTGSFTVFPNKNNYKCFGCGETGDSVNFVMQYSNINYPDALIHLAQKYSIWMDEKPTQEVRQNIEVELKRAESIRKRKEAEAEKKKAKVLKFLIDTALNANRSEAEKYLSGRSIPPSSLPENSFFQLDAYKEHPAGVVFLDSEKKLVNKRNFNVPPGGSKQFNWGTVKNAVYDNLFRSELDTVFTTEGVINAQSIYLQDKSVIALFATTNEIDDVNKFKTYFENKHVVIAFDFDKKGAGQRAAIKRYFWIQENFKTKSIKILIHPEGMDDNDLHRKGELSSLLENKYSYINLSQEKLNELYLQVKASSKFIPEFPDPYTFERGAGGNEEDGTFTKVTDPIPGDVFQKINISGKVEKQTLRDCKFEYVKEYTVIKNRKATTYLSSIDNPIFTLDEKIIIRPFAKKVSDKVQFFGTQNEEIYHYGLKNLEATYMNKDDDEDDSGKPIEKLPRAILVYNFIDFLTLSAIGEHPIFIHNKLDYEIKQSILGFVFTIYQAPTNGNENKERSNYIAIKNIEIRTYRLENRTYSVSHLLKKVQIEFFKKHLNSALPYKFWEWDKKNKDFDLNVIILRSFLNAKGYYKHDNKRGENDYIYVKKTGKVVSKIEKDLFAMEVKIMIDKYLESRGEQVKLRNKIIISRRFSELNLSTMDKVKFDFENAGVEFQNMFFADGKIWTITKDKIYLREQKELKKHVWEDEMLNYPSEVKSAPFRIFLQKEYAEALKKNSIAKTAEEKKRTQHELSKFDQTDKYDIEILNRDNYYLQYLFATSYAYFEKAEKAGHFVKPSDFWYTLPDGLLTDKEVNTIKLHLINKITWLGYMMKDHRQPTDDFGLAILDAIDDFPDGRKRGASGGGKTLIADSIGNIKRILPLNAANEDFTNDKFRYQQFSGEKIIVCNDMHLRTKIGDMLTDFSEGITIGVKHKTAHKLSLKESPKIIITRNYVDNEGERVDRRLGRMFVFPFFHDSKSGRFSKKRTPSDYFGRMLFTADNESEKSDLVNFFAYAYMANRNFGEVNPPMQDMEKFRLTQRIGELLIDYMDTYFDDFENYGYIDRVPFHNSFLEQNRFNFSQWQRKNYTSSKKFKSLVADYCKMRGLIFNPDELLTDENRIRRISDSQQNKVGNYKQTEHFFIGTEAIAKEEINDTKVDVSEPSEISTLFGPGEIDQIEYESRFDY